MKKSLSLVLVLVMLMSLSIPAFADKPAWAGNQKNDEEVDRELPKGLQKKDVIPYGHRKDQEVSVDDMEDFIEVVEEYIEDLDVDSDDDGIEDGEEDDELSVDIIDLDAAEEIALDEKDGSIVKMSFEGDSYTFEIWFEDELFEVEIDGIDEDTDVEAEDDEYDLDDVMSYNQAKIAALDIIADEEDMDSDDVEGIFIEVELDIESDDDDDEATYTVEFKTTDKTYEIKFDAFNGDLLDFDSEASDDDDEDWERDRDRDRDRDDDDEGMVSAIENLIDRIEYELEKEEPKLGHFMFQLEKKFNTLQKVYGEAPEKEDYTEDLEELRDKLEDIKEDSVFTEDEKEEIQELIDDIDDVLDTEEPISEDEYEDFQAEADEYLDMVDEKVEVDEVKALVTEIRGFVLENEFGSEVGEYSQEDAMELLMLVFEYPSVDEETLDEYFSDLKLAYKKFKMSKLVKGEYLETLLDYKEDLEALNDEDLTTDEIDLRDDVIALITRIENAGKMPLGIFYDLEEDALSLIEDSVETPEDYEVALDELIDDVRETIFTTYEDVDQGELRSEKMTLLSYYFEAIEDQGKAETEENFETAFTVLETALNSFNEFLEQ